MKSPLCIFPLAVFVLAAALGQNAESSSRPNIILIMADDLGYSDIGCYGSEIATPNIDKLAGEGLRFSQFYTNPVCVPARASLLTGMYPHQVGRALAAEPGWVAAGIPSAIGDDLPSPYGHYRPEAYGKSEPGTPGGLSPDSVTLAEALREAGYTTLMSGKWHCGETEENWPVNRGFDRYFGLLQGAANYFDIEKDYLQPRKMMLDDQFFTPPADGFYMTDAITDYAVRFLGDQKASNSPFFLYVAYTAPHTPLHAWPESIEKFSGKFKEGWDALRKKRYERLREMGILGPETGLSPRDHAVRSWRITELIHEAEKQVLRKEVYSAMIHLMDKGIGRILEQLESLGEKDNTLVVFLSDNGADSGELDSDLGDLDSTLPPGGENTYEPPGLGWANLANTPFRLYKQWVHEGGIATPLIVRWPREIPDPGSIRHDLGHVMDFLPTFRDIAGISHSGGNSRLAGLEVEGHSLLPVLRGAERAGYSHLCWENEGHRAIRKGKWKLVAKYYTWELYDMEKDRSELNNLAAAHPELVRELAGHYDQWAKRVGAGIPGRSR